jgi:uncharacterized damage-inducible protein DinB
MTDQIVDEQGRVDTPFEGTEAETLLGFLDYQRATFAWKTRGLTDDQLRQGLPPTSMTLAGMLKHLAVVEDGWFARVASDAPMPEPWVSVDWDSDPDWDWSSAHEQTGDELRDLWNARVENSRAVVATQLSQGVAEGLDRTHSAWGGAGRVSLRWILCHMIEEYARHNGHADLLRESIDGETGE